MALIKDGTGSGSGAKVNANNRLYVNAISQTEAESATELGNSYNINSGVVSLTGATNSTVMYLKNNELVDLHVRSIEIGIGSGAQSDSAIIAIIRNPTLGTIIDNAVVAPINQNRNFGSSKLLTADAYTGVDGDTLTDGNTIVSFFQTVSETFRPVVDLILTKGDSIGIKIDPNLSSGSVNVCVSLVAQIEDPLE